MFQLNRLKFLFTLRRFSLSASSSASRDLYSTLGVNRNASAKEIKSAFYELSKKYHPDRNPDNKEAAVVKFQDIVNAYEVLSNSDKRREYDSQFVRPRHPGAGPISREAKNKQYTDLDIDFKDLEYFQRMAKRRQQSSGYRYESAEEFMKRYDNYKSNAAYEREKAEKKLREELEQRKREARYQTPTFEQMLREEERRKDAEFMKSLRAWAIIVIFVFVLLTLFGTPPRMY